MKSAARASLARALGRVGPAAAGTDVPGPDGMPVARAAPTPMTAGILSATAVKPDDEDA